MKPAVARATPVLLGLAAVAALFAAYSFLPLAAPPVAASPDENANRFFARRFAETGTLWHFEPLNLDVGGLVHPRSTRVVDDFVVPGGFLGLPVIYGGIAAVLGADLIPFLTPLFAVAGVACWGMLVARFFGRRIGVAAAILIAAHPAWWYETARTLQPNTLFLSLVLIAAWLVLCTPIAGALVGRGGLPLLRRADAPLAGICCGLALAVRPSEAYWLLIVGGVALAAAGRRALPRAAVFGVFVVLTLVPFLSLNKAVYGSYLATGYGVGTDVPVADLPQGRGAALLGPLRPWLFPLGFAPRDALRRFAAYGIGFFWGWTALVAAALGALAFTVRRLRAGRHKVSRPALAWAIAGSALSFWLILFYGSWAVQDNPDPAAVTIGSSYLRYWLPVFVVSTLPVAWVAVTAVERFLRPAFRKPVLAVAAAVYVAASAFAILASPQEGLLALRSSLLASDQAARLVAEHTPSDALIVVDRADKFLFPQRKVIVTLRSEATYAALDKLKGRVPLYYFGITFPEADLRYLREEKLPPLGLSVEPVVSFGEETLYELKAKSE
jgi:hypothetical protein